MRLPLPPIHVQRRLVEILEDLDDQIRTTELVVNKLDSTRFGVVQELLTADDVSSVEPLGSLAEVNSGVTLGSEPGGPGTLTRPYLRVANVQDGHLDLREIKSIRVRQADLPRFELRLGDVLMNEGGDADKLGRGTVWEGQIPGCLHQNHVFRVRCTSGILDPWYLAVISGSASGKRYFLSASKQTTNLATINSRQIKAFPVPLRTPARQRQIVQTVKSLGDRLNLENQRLAKLRRIKTGLLADLLSGRVRVSGEATG
jgi:type I restriction enzyme S subunit